MAESSAPAPVDRLAEWQAVDAALRQRQTVYGIATREQVAGKSGLAIFQAMIAGELPAPRNHSNGFIGISRSSARRITTDSPFGIFSRSEAIVCASVSALAVATATGSFSGEASVVCGSSRISGAVGAALIPSEIKRS